MRLLVIYGTTEGQTRKVGEYLEKEARLSGHAVELRSATSEALPGPEGFDAVILASSIHIGKYHPSIANYIQKHHQGLNQVHSAFVSVSLTAAGRDARAREDLERITQEFLDDVGWKPGLVEQVAGALPFTKYGMLKKLIMRFISKRAGGDTDVYTDHEHTDWDQVKSLLDKMGVRDREGQPDTLHNPGAKPQFRAIDKGR